jgi:hypothetical protein
VAMAASMKSKSYLSTEIAFFLTRKSQFADKFILGKDVTFEIQEKW